MSTDNKMYKLLRDLPDAKAGTIFTFDGDDSYRYESEQYKDGISWYRECCVVDNPTWFEELIPTKPFVCEYKVSVGDTFKGEKVEYVGMEGTAVVIKTKQPIHHTSTSAEWEIVSYFDKIIKNLSISELKNMTGGELAEKENLVIKSVRRLSDNKVIEVSKTHVQDKSTGHYWIVSELTTKDNRCFANGVNISENHLWILPPPTNLQPKKEDNTGVIQRCTYNHTDVVTDNSDVACLSLNDVYHELKMICDGTFGSIDRWNFILSSEDTPHNFYKQLEQKVKEKLKQ